MEWEKAARGPDGRIFPWGDVSDVSRANTNTTGSFLPPSADLLRPVDSYPSGASPYGALQMVGNAWELVDKQRTPPADTSPFKTLKPPAQPGEAWYMIRGESAWESLVENASWDSNAVPGRWKDLRTGFRCAKDAK